KVSGGEFVPESSRTRHVSQIPSFLVDLGLERQVQRWRIRVTAHVPARVQETHEEHPVGFANTDPAVPKLMDPSVPRRLLCMTPKHVGERPCGRLAHGRANPPRVRVRIREESLGDRAEVSRDRVYEIAGHYGYGEGADQ